MLVMDVIDKEKYEALAEKFQREQVDLLKQTLSKYGVEYAVAKEICGEFSFDLAMLFDQGELSLDKEIFRPVVAFTSDEENFFVQPAGVAFHEYAFGTVADAYDAKH